MPGRGRSKDVTCTALLSSTTCGTASGPPSSEGCTKKPLKTPMQIIEARLALKGKVPNVHSHALQALKRETPRLKSASASQTRRQVIFLRGGAVIKPLPDDPDSMGTGLATTWVDPTGATSSMSPSPGHIQFCRSAPMAQPVKLQKWSYSWYHKSPGVLNSWSHCHQLLGADRRTKTTRHCYDQPSKNP